MAYYLGSFVLLLILVVALFVLLAIILFWHTDRQPGAEKWPDDHIFVKRRLGVGIVAVLVIISSGAAFFKMSEPVNSRVGNVKYDGRAIGIELSTAFVNYTSFGDGKSGSMTAKGEKAKDILVSPMHHAVGGKGTRSVNTYGVESFTYDDKGPGLVDIYSNAATQAWHISSANYGTKATGTDLSWCFVLHDQGVYVKFTNNASGYPWSLNPLTCVNGR